MFVWTVIVWGLPMFWTTPGCVRSPHLGAGVPKVLTATLLSISLAATSNRQPITRGVNASADAASSHNQLLRRMKRVEICQTDQNPRNPK
eukprot:2079634-Amphidinium_carterae.1